MGKRERNFKKLERKFGSFNWQNPEDVCNVCGPIDPAFDAFIAGLLDEDTAQLTEAQKRQVEKALADSTDVDGKVNWAFFASVVEGVQSLRAARWSSIYQKACMPGATGKIDPNDPSSHPAWALRKACQEQKAQAEPEPEAPRAQVDIGTVGSALPWQAAAMVGGAKKTTPWWYWAAPAGLLFLIFQQR